MQDKMLILAIEMGKAASGVAETDPASDHSIGDASNPRAVILHFEQECSVRSACPQCDFRRDRRTGSPCLNAFMSGDSSSGGTAAPRTSSAISRSKLNLSCESRTHYRKVEIQRLELLVQ